MIYERIPKGLNGKERMVDVQASGMTLNQESLVTQDEQETPGRSISMHNTSFVTQTLIKSGEIFFLNALNFEI